MKLSPENREALQDAMCKADNEGTHYYLTEYVTIEDEPWATPEIIEAVKVLKEADRKVWTLINDLCETNEIEI